MTLGAVRRGLLLPAALPCLLVVGPGRKHLPPDREYRGPAPGEGTPPCIDTPVPEDREPLRVEPEALP